MKILTRIVVLTILDFLIIWFWVKQMDPDPSVSIGILLLVPLVIVINLVIALILFFTKRQFAKLFLINSIISAFLMHFLFSEGINRHQRDRLESWEFKMQDTTYNIIHWKLENSFSISESMNPGSSTVFLDGTFVEKDKEYHLTTDSTNFTIKNEFLFGFRNDSIKLTKLER